MLTAIEAMRAATTLPLAAMPNAGMPRAVEGRNIYLCSPEYMASFARKAIAAGAQFVGGCCGTTPNHIRAMRSAMRAIDAQARVAEGAQPSLRLDRNAARAAGSALEHRLAGRAGQFITLVEIVPPKGIDCAKEIEGARLLAQLGVHAINVPDSPRASARMSAQSLCIQIQQHTGHRDGSALHLPRPQHSQHSIGPARRLVHRTAQYSLPHRRPAEAGKLS